MSQNILTAPRRPCFRSARFFTRPIAPGPPVAKPGGWPSSRATPTSSRRTRWDCATSSAPWERPWVKTMSRGCKRLADLVVLVFDGDDAGQTAADRALELFLGHELDVRILSLPANLDPCDFLLKEGADAFRELVAGAVDPLAFVLERAATRFDFGAIEGSRRAAEWVLGILSRIPSTQRIGMDLKLAKSLDNLALRLNQPVDYLRRRLRELRQAARPRPGSQSPVARGRGEPVAGPRRRPSTRLRPAALRRRPSGSATLTRSTASWFRSCSTSQAWSRNWFLVSPPPRCGMLLCGRSCRLATTSTARGNRLAPRRSCIASTTPRFAPWRQDCLLPMDPAALARERASRFLARSPQRRARHPGRARAAKPARGPAQGPGRNR